MAVQNLVLLTLAVSLAAADTVRLREQASVSGPGVKLSNIAELSGEYAQNFAEVSLGNVPAGQSMAISIDQVRQALSQAKANWGRLSLSGYARCQVRADADVQSTTPAPIVANPVHEVSLDSGLTLRQQVIAQLAALHDVEADNLQIEFDPHDEAVLQRTTLGERLDIQPTGELGRVLIAVRRWRGQELIATHRLTAQVARKAMAVVMRQSISRGQTFTDQHVAVEPVLLRDSREQPLQALESVIGSLADQSLRVGAVVYPRAVKTPLLVQRNELVTVRALAGGLAITTTARAMQDGVLGDLVQVRNERSREVYQVKVSGLRQATLLVQPQSPSEGGAS